MWIGPAPSFGAQQHPFPCGCGCDKLCYSESGEEGYLSSGGFHFGDKGGSSLISSLHSSATFHKEGGGVRCADRARDT